MLDLNHLPQNVVFNEIIHLYEPRTDTLNALFSCVSRPRNTAMVFIVCLGGAGGGGGGRGGAAGSVKGGGGGGGSSAVSNLLIPWIFLPDVLHYNVGKGGPGGAGGTSADGSSGGTSFFSRVNIAPYTATVQNTILRSSTVTATSGAGGTITGSASGGVGGTVNSILNSLRAGIGVFSFIAGQNGANGGSAGSNGGSGTFPTSGVSCMGGTGGGSPLTADTGGGAITSITDSRFSQDKAIISAVGANNGPGGFSLWGILCCYPGFGAGGSNSVPGGYGGHGYNGSGGGGGGGGVTTGGNGGHGGDGYICFIAW